MAAEAAVANGLEVVSAVAAPMMAEGILLLDNWVAEDRPVEAGPQGEVVVVAAVRLEIGRSDRVVAILVAANDGDLVYSRRPSQTICWVGN